MYKPTEGVRTPGLKDELELGSWGGVLGVPGSHVYPDPSPGVSAFTGLVVLEAPGQSDLQPGRRMEDPWKEDDRGTVACSCTIQDEGHLRKWAALPAPRPPP